jgi:CRP-like cAMP-binding protein
VLLPLRGNRAMTPIRRSPNGNRLLDALTPADLGLLQPNLEAVCLPLRHDLEKPNKRIDDIYFMGAGIASVVAIQPNDTRIEIGLVGCEGMTGTSVVLGNDRSPHATYIQAVGEGRRITAIELRKAMKESASLHGLLLKYVQAFMVQTAHTAIANARAKLDVRLARWVLMAHDRVAGNKLSLTHEFLSLMLGVRRAGVTEALHILESRKLIKSRRGEIIVLNRRGIEKSAGNFYGVPEAEYRRLFS